MSATNRRFDKLLKAMLAGPAPSAAPKGRKAVADERETRNPLPQKDYTEKQQPYCDDEENDPEIDGR